MSTCIQYLNELMNLQEKLKDPNDGTKVIKSKSETFLKNLSNIYSELNIELQKSIQKNRDFMSELAKQGLNLSDVNERARKIFEENKNLEKKIKDLELVNSQVSAFFAFTIFLSFPL